MGALPQAFTLHPNSRDMDGSEPPLQQGEGAGVQSPLQPHPSNQRDHQRRKQQQEIPANANTQIGVVARATILGLHRRSTQ